MNLANPPAPVRRTLAVAIASLTVVHPALAADPAVDTLVVTGARLSQALNDAIGDITVLGRDVLDTARGLTLAEILAAQPGVQIQQNGGLGKVAGVFLRGASAQQTLVLIDGVRFGSATAGVAALHHLPLDQIERVEILRGPAASLYGADAIGGVIQVFTRSPRSTPQAAIELGLGNHNSRELQARLAGQSGATRYALSFADNYSDGVSAIANPSNVNYNPDRDSYRNTSVSANASHAFNPANSLGASLLLARTRSQFDSAYYDANFNPILQSYDYREKGWQGGGKLWSQHQLSPIWNLRLSVGESVDESVSYAPASDRGGERTSEFTTHQTQMVAQNELKLAGGIATLGLESLRQSVSGDTQYDLDSRRINSLLAGYLVSEKAWSLQANLRQDRNSQFGNYRSGQLGLGWQVAPELKLGGSLSSGFRAPNFNELYFPDFGNTSLKPEKSLSRELFARWQTGAWQGSLTAYHNEVRDLLQFDSATFSTANIGRATLRGATLQQVWRATNWNLGGNYDWLDAVDSSGRSNDGRKLPRRAKQAAALHIGWADKGWSLRAEIQGQGERFDDGANRLRLAGYAVTNLYAAWQIQPQWQLSLRLNNAFDREYESTKDYGTLGRSVFLSVRWEPTLGAGR